MNKQGWPTIQREIPHGNTNTVQDFVIMSTGPVGLVDPVGLQGLRDLRDPVGLRDHQGIRDHQDLRGIQDLRDHRDHRVPQVARGYGLQ